VVIPLIIWEGHVIRRDFLDRARIDNPRKRAFRADREMTGTLPSGSPNRRRGEDPFQKLGKRLTPRLDAPT
jgi:hypothetical protein